MHVYSIYQSNSSLQLYLLLWKPLHIVAWLLGIPLFSVITNEVEFHPPRTQYSQDRLAVYQNPYQDKVLTENGWMDKWTTLEWSKSVYNNSYYISSFPNTHPHDVCHWPIPDIHFSILITPGNDPVWYNIPETKSPTGSVSKVLHSHAPSWSLLFLYSLFLLISVTLARPPINIPAQGQSEINDYG